MKMFLLAALIFLSSQQRSDAGVFRKPPAFATPVYSNSYLPAAMQVIFHAVEQLKNLETEENVATTTSKILPATSPHAPGQHQPSAEEQAAMQSTLSIGHEESTASISYSASTESANEELTLVTGASQASLTSSPPELTSDSAASELFQHSEQPQESTASIAALSFEPLAYEAQSTASLAEFPGEVNEEKPEVSEESTSAVEENYATPEINHEAEEVEEEVSESKDEEAEKKEREEVTRISHSSNTSEEDGAKSSSEESKESGQTERETWSDGKSDGKSGGKSDGKSDEDDSSEEEDDEIRFTLIGEKVAQVPRPSLSSYLRKTARAPLRGSVQELATLYDALSKDARKQGLGRYSGYSDEVLQTLESSIEGGVGPQLRILLEKACERKELTRDDAKAKLAATLKKLADPGSVLSRDLRTLLPLRYIP